VYHYLKRRACITGCFTDEQIKDLENYVLPYSIRDSGQITEIGADEHFNLGIFWREKFPEIFDKEYSESLYKVWIP